MQKPLNHVCTCSDYDDADEQIWTDRLKQFHAIMNHWWDKHKLNEQCKMIVADFKQNMVIGRSQIEVSEAYRQSREPWSVLGF